MALECLERGQPRRGLDGALGAVLAQRSDHLVDVGYVTNVLRANGYSLATALGASAETIGSSGPGSFSGPFVASRQALAVLVALIDAFVACAGTALRRRDVA